MFKRIFAYIAIMLPAVAMAQTAPEAFMINGRLSQVKQSY